MLTLLQTLLVLMMLFSAICLVRNDMVYKYRNGLIDRVSARNDQDIDQGIDPSWRWKEYRKVDYQLMVYKFWKPINSFYDEKELLK